MKKLFKAMAIIPFVFLMVFMMTGCSEYNFYDDFHAAGSEIEEDNIYKVLTLEEAKKMKDEGQTFALIYGSSESDETVTIITRFQTQAEYLGNPTATIYFVNSKDYTTSSQRKEVRDALGMHDPTSNGAPVIMTFKSSRVDLDTSNKDKTKTKEFYKNGMIQYSSVASYIFRELLATNN